MASTAGAWGNIYVYDDNDDYYDEDDDDERKMLIRLKSVSYSNEFVRILLFDFAFHI